jgi:hypothetical protein
MDGDGIFCADFAKSSPGSGFGRDQNPFTLSSDIGIDGPTGVSKLAA